MQETNFSDLKLADPMEEVLMKKQTVLKLDYDFEDGVKVSKTTNGFHVEIPFFGSDIEVLAMQILLGSDIKREFFNMRRLANGRSHWNILFQEKWKYNHDTKEYELISKEVPL